MRKNREHQTELRAQQPNRRPAKQVNKALGPQAMLSEEGATFLGVNRGTSSCPKARMTSPPCAPHPFGDHPHLSLHATATGKLVPTRDLRVVSCVHWDPEARSPSATSCLHLRHLSAEPGPRTASDRASSQLLEALLWAQVPGFPLRRAASLGRTLQETVHATVARRAAL